MAEWPCELLSDKCTPDRGEERARLLSEGTWTHDHPITCQRAKSFGLPVRNAIPAEFLDLLSLYPSQSGVNPQWNIWRNPATPRVFRAGDTSLLWRDAEFPHQNRECGLKEGDAVRPLAQCTFFSSQLSKNLAMPSLFFSSIISCALPGRPTSSSFT